MALGRGYQTIELLRQAGQSVGQGLAGIGQGYAQRAQFSQEQEKLDIYKKEKQAKLDQEEANRQGNAQLAQQVAESAKGASPEVQKAAGQILGLLTSPSPEIREQGHKAYLDFYKKQYIDPLEKKAKSLDDQLQGLYLEQEQAREAGDKKSIAEVDKRVKQTEEAFKRFSTLKARFSADAMKEKKPEQFDIDVLELKMTARGYVPTEAEEEAFVRERYSSKSQFFGVPPSLTDKFTKGSFELVRKKYGYGAPRPNNSSAQQSGSQPPPAATPTAPTANVDSMLKELDEISGSSPTN